MMRSAFAHFLGGNPPIMWTKIATRTKTMQMKRHIGCLSFLPDIIGPRERARQGAVADHGTSLAGLRLGCSGWSSGKLREAVGPRSSMAISSYMAAASSGEWAYLRYCL